MSSSPVVDLGSWRERTRVVRPATAAEPEAARLRPAAGGAVSGAPAGVTVLRTAAPPGPVSVFGPVMAFGLVPRPGPLLTAAPEPAEQPVALTAVPDPERDRPVGPLSAAASVSSAPAPRARTRLDGRGTPRGPRR